METLLFTLELPSWRHCGFCLLVSGVTQQQDKNMQECASACRSKPQASVQTAPQQASRGEDLLEDLTPISLSAFRLPSILHSLIQVSVFTRRRH